MSIDNNRLRDILVNNNFVDSDTFDDVKQEADRLAIDVQEVLLQKGILKDEHLGWLLADELGYQYINLKEHEIDEQVLQLIPEIVARSRQVVAFAKNANDIQVGMVDPSDLEIIHMIQKKTGLTVFPYLIMKGDLLAILPRYKSSLVEEFQKLSEQYYDTSLSLEAHDELIVQIVDLLLQFGYRSEASDIHIEPFEDKVNVRFRIDGIMHDVLPIPRDLYQSILTRIKIMAKLRTDEHQAPQDGRLRFQFDEDNIDVRVSIVPVTKGENIVMRLLSSAIRNYNLNNIGMGERDTQLINSFLKNPKGIMLVVGPTGSGKTTTVYAVMKILNTPEVHISSIEDPVEYDIQGISQIQVNPNVGLTFADGLRSIVRQDPDIIIVGEIRDTDTANIAINAAMTGHIVLSTLHANNAATTIIRLMDMDVEEYLVASTVSFIVAQRLVRKICPSCRTTYIMTSEEKQLLDSIPDAKAAFEAFADEDTRLYKGKGCNVCDHTGFHGRIGIFEILTVDEEIRQGIKEHASHHELEAIARKNGMTTMLEDGIQKVVLGETTIQEVFRVVHE